MYTLTESFIISRCTERNVYLNTRKTNDYESDLDSIVILLKAMRHDPIINKKVLNILNMDPHPRRIVLSNWLEQLRRNNAPGKLTQTLSFLFDDSIAEKVYELINKSKKN